MFGEDAATVADVRGFVLEDCFRKCLVVNGRQ